MRRLDSKPDRAIRSPKKSAAMLTLLRQAAADRNAAKVPELSLSVTEVREAHGGLDTKEAVTVEQAARDLAAARADISKFADGFNFASIGDDVDLKRAEAVEGDKAKAKHFGFELEDGAKSEAKPDAKDVARPASPRGRSGGCRHCRRDRRRRRSR